MQCNTSLDDIDMLVEIPAACLDQFQLDQLSYSCATAVCVSSYFNASLCLSWSKITDSCMLSTFVQNLSEIYGMSLYQEI